MGPIGKREEVSPTRARGRGIPERSRWGDCRRVRSTGRRKDEVLNEAVDWEAMSGSLFRRYAYIPWQGSSKTSTHRTRSRVHWRWKARTGRCARACHVCATEAICGKRGRTSHVSCGHTVSKKAYE